MLIYDPGLGDRILDPGEQTHELLELWAVEAKLFITGGECSPIDDSLDRICAAAVHESP